MAEIPGFPRAHSRDLDRQAIEEFRIPGIVLMEHASLGTALLACDALAELRPDGVLGAHVWILCGPGNNGGDGYAVARHLHNAGARVTVWDLVDGARIRGDARTNREILPRIGLEPVAAHPSLPTSPTGVHLAVDAIFGTGLSRAPAGVFAAAIEALLKEAVPTLSVDIPSGLDADTGAPLGTTVRARWTATYGLNKIGFSAPGAGAFTGQVWCVPIGVPRQLLPAGTPPFPPAPFSVSGGADRPAAGQESK